MTVMTALKEANQAGSLQPTTLVSYDADLQPLFDTHDAQALFEYGIDTKTLGATTWRDDMKMMGEAPTQRLARDLKNAGFCGLIAKIFAPGTVAGDRNVILWKWGPSSPHRLTLIDDDNRLSTLAHFLSDKS